MNSTILPKVNFIKKGTIIAFNGPITSENRRTAGLQRMPVGWVLCDGENGTPDLRGRFIYGKNEIGEESSIGGNAEAPLTAAQLPAHTHVMTAVGHHTHGTSNDATSRLKQFGFKDGGDAPIYAVTGGHGGIGFSTSVTGAHSHPIGNTGQGGTHENMPPFCVLSYIMKV